MKRNFLVLTFIINTFSVAQNIDLFIWAGQSNALGRKGNAVEYPIDPNNYDDQILFNWTVVNQNSSNGWINSMEPQVGYFPDGHFGPEVSFSRKLVENGYNPAIFKYTLGGTSIFEHWLTPGKGGFYDFMILDLNTAINELENQGFTINFRGFIWIQGESDSNSQEAALAYFNNLNSIINDIRIITKTMDLPIVLGVDENYFTLPNQQQPEILNAHQKLALNDDNIKFSSMYGFPKADMTHLTPTGLINHGKNIFDTYQILISGNTPLSNCTLHSEGKIVSSTKAKSWGQSFTTDCSGIISSIKFNVASNLNNSATITLYNGANCRGDILLTKTLNNLKTGNNTIAITDNLYLEKEHTYYIKISSDTDTKWRVYHSNTNKVFGNLKSYNEEENSSSCNKEFLNFDMSFSIKISDINNVNDIVLFPNPTTGIINLKSNENTTVIVYNLIGQIVYKKDNVYHQFRLNLTKGLYFVHLILKNGKNNIEKILLK